MLGGQIHVQNLTIHTLFNLLENINFALHGINLMTVLLEYFMYCALQVTARDLDMKHIPAT